MKQTIRKIFVISSIAGIGMAAITPAFAARQTYSTPVIITTTTKPPISLP